jgi:hypothetical protein
VRRVYIASPLSAPTQAERDANVALAKRLCHYATIIDGVAAFAPHAYFTIFLDDAVPEEREIGMDAGKAWLEAADELWVFTRRGISMGMAREIERAAREGTPVRWDPVCWAGVE